MPSHKSSKHVDVDDNFILPDGDPARGQLLFKKHRSQCHTIRRDGVNPYGTLWGPNLYGVMGRTAAQNHRTGWKKYSETLESSGILWTDKNMMAFLKNPRSFAGGVINMNFRGLENFQDRVDLVYYLKRAGHEAWMVRDGTPHSQKEWWTRERRANTSPGAKMWGAIVAKVSEVGASMMPTGQLNLRPSDDEVSTEIREWRRVQKVADGVKPASAQQSFNWPPPEMIAEGPLRKGKVVPSRSATSVSPQSESSKTTAPTVTFCEEVVKDELCRGWRAPSGLLVYADHGGPAAAGAVASNSTPKPVLSTKVSSPSRADVVTSANLADAPVRPDGGRLTQSGLIAYPGNCL